MLNISSKECDKTINNNKKLIDGEVKSEDQETRIRLGSVV